MKMLQTKQIKQRDVFPIANVLKKINLFESHWSGFYKKWFFQYSIACISFFYIEGDIENDYPTNWEIKFFKVKFDTTLGNFWNFSFNQMCSIPDTLDQLFDHFGSKESGITQIEIPECFELKSATSLVKHLDLSEFLLDRASLTFKPQNGNLNYCLAETIENERTCDGFEVI